MKKRLNLHSFRDLMPLEDGSLLYVDSHGDSPQIWHYTPETRQSRPVTQGDERVMGLHAVTKDWVLFSGDVGGSENAGIQAKQLGSGATRSFSQGPGVRQLFGAFRESSQEILFASNARHAATFDLWAVPFAGGEPRILVQNSDHYNWPATEALSPCGRYFLYNKLKGEYDNALWMLDLEKGTCEPIAEGQLPSAETSPSWRHDSQGFYCVSSRFADKSQVAYYSLAEKRLDLLFESPLHLEGLTASPRKMQLLLLWNQEGYSQLELLDFASMQRRPIEEEAPFVLSGMPAWAPDGGSFFYAASRSEQPAWVSEYDAVGHRRRLVMDQPAFPGDQSFAIQSFDSFDGEEIPYLLALPAGANKPVPMIILIHGGPEGQARPSYHAVAQIFLAEGIGVCLPNVRGSSGYGKRYGLLDNVEKRLDSVQDIDSLVQHLIDARIAKDTQLAVMGTSYGGFMTLSCLARFPDRWACGVDIVGMFNLVSFLERTADYRRLHRESEYGSLAKDRELLYQVSPVAVIAQLKAPTMVIQGANDPRVPKHEADQIVEVLKAAQIPHSYLLYDNEGHGLSRLDNKLDAYPKLLAFMKEHLGLA